MAQKNFHEKVCVVREKISATKSHEKMRVVLAAIGKQKHHDQNACDGRHRHKERPKWSFQTFLS
jgi:hypothetical protein